MSVEIKMPQLGLTMEEGEVSAWHIKEGDTIKEGDVIGEITTDKLTNDLVSEVSGTVLKLVASEGEDVVVQGVLAIIGEPGESVDEPSDSGAEEATTEEPKEEAPAEKKAEPVKRQEGERVRISPLARKIAEKHNLDYSALAGTGPMGRIVQKDVLKALDEQGKEEAPAIFAEPTAKEEKKEQAPAASGAVELMEGDEVEKLSGMRKVVAQRMTQSSQEIPSVTQDIKVDVTKLLDFRAGINEGREVRISLNDFIIKATAKALRKHPEINVSLDGNNRIKRAMVNIGMAVGLDDGLLVPVIRNADTKSLETISQEAKDLAGRAKDGSLDASEYKGSTFSISNIGMFGITSFTPIINQPDAAILGVCATEDVLALTEEGEITTKKVMTLSLTFDHRLIDGATAAKFQQTLKAILENPIDILL